MLTDRQQQTYDFIRAYARRHGVTPKLREVAEYLGISSRGSIHRYLRAIEAQGLITVEPGRARGIRLAAEPGMPDNARALMLPLMGRIAAGRPIEAIAGQDHIDLSEFFVGPNRFVLRVQGDSMVEDGILDGDMVVVEQRNHAEDGEIVVALIDNEEATLKRLQRNGDGSITLRPANRLLTPMRYPGERVRVQGVVVGQLRVYR